MNSIQNYAILNMRHWLADLKDDVLVGDWTSWSEGMSRAETGQFILLQLFGLKGFCLIVNLCLNWASSSLVLSIVSMFFVHQWIMNQQLTVKYIVTLHSTIIRLTVLRHSYFSKVSKRSALLPEDCYAFWVSHNLHYYGFHEVNNGLKTNQ